MVEGHETGGGTIGGLQFEIPIFFSFYLTLVTTTCGFSDTERKGKSRGGKDQTTELDLICTLT